MKRHSSFRKPKLSKTLPNEEIRSYVRKIWHDEAFLKQGNVVAKSGERVPFAKAFQNILIGSIDFMRLYLQLRLGNIKDVVITSSSFVAKGSDGNTYDRICGEYTENDVVYINESSSQSLIIANVRSVYNIGYLVPLLTRLSDYKESQDRFMVYGYLWRVLFHKVESLKIIIPWSYCSSSIGLLSVRGNNVHVTEIQHGSIVGYPPYCVRPPYKTPDRFILNSKKSAMWLQESYTTHKTDFIVKEAPRIAQTLNEKIILYVSTPELNGLHPVFLRFLNRYNWEYPVIVRLHPRDKIDKTRLLKKYPLITFDTTNDWSEHRKYRYLRVIASWSSIIEEAAESGTTVLIIDEIGIKRFENYLTRTNVYRALNAFEVNRIIHDKL